MRPLISFLLIPIFMLGHVVPHSHVASDSAEADDHLQRPHIHLGHDHDHGHSHCQAECQCDATSSPRGEISQTTLAPTHDCDAIYIAATDWTASRHAVSIDPGATGDAYVSAPPISLQRKQLQAFELERSDPHLALPIYLMTASLRL